MAIKSVLFDEFDEFDAFDEFTVVLDAFVEITLMFLISERKSSVVTFTMAYVVTQCDVVTV